jgi:hypothetical protein
MPYLRFAGNMDDAYLHCHPAIPKRIIASLAILKSSVSYR